MNTLHSIVAAALLTLPAAAQDHRFEADPVVTVRENFVACDVLSQLQRVMDNPRFLLKPVLRPAPLPKTPANSRFSGRARSRCHIPREKMENCDSSTPDRTARSSCSRMRR
jgi:hypothetical protein